MSFALFVGVNHHGQSILLECRILSSEDTNTFVWLFDCWLRCILGSTWHCDSPMSSNEMSSLLSFPKHAPGGTCDTLWKKLSEKLYRYTEYKAIKKALNAMIYIKKTLKAMIYESQHVKRFWMG